MENIREGYTFQPISQALRRQMFEKIPAILAAEYPTPQDHLDKVTAMEGVRDFIEIGEPEQKIGLSASPQESHLPLRSYISELTDQKDLNLRQHAINSLVLASLQQHAPADPDTLTHLQLDAHFKDKDHRIKGQLTAAAALFLIRDAAKSANAAASIRNIHSRGGFRFDSSGLIAPRP